MSTRAKWGSLKGLLVSLKPGESFIETKWSRRCVIYCTAKRARIGITIHQIGGRKAKGRYGFIATITS